MKKTFAILVASACFANFSATAADSNDSRPDAHAPVGVMRDHVHKKGEYMLSYRYDFMRMKGSKMENNQISPADVIAKDYHMAPLNMNMRMHMVGAMYGLTDELSLMAMGSFMSSNMKMVDSMNDGQTSKHEVEGFGDTSLTAMYGFFKERDRHAQFNLGVSIPTGGIKKEDHGQRVPYMMQLGSGSYELLPGLSYTGFKDSYSYGAQVNGQFRLNNNNAGYRLGDVYNTTAWVAKQLNESFSVSSRLNYTITEQARGFDRVLNTEHSLMMSPTNNSAFTGGRRLDALAGVNFIVPSGALKGHRLALEGGVPVYQKVNGIQMRNSYSVTFGWQKAF